MDKNIKKDEIDWDNILVLEELLAYFNTYYTKEFSLVSPAVRNKLKSSLLNKINLSDKSIINKFNKEAVNKNEFEDMSKLLEYMKNPFNYGPWNEESETQLYNNSSILILKNMLVDEMKEIRRYIKILCVCKLADSFYFLYPAILELGNLTQLELRECAIPLLVIFKIGENMKKLKILSLSLVDLIELNKQELSLDEVHLPYNLSELSIECCRVYNLKAVLNLHSLLHLRYEYKRYDSKRLRALKIPSLKKLSLGYEDDVEFIIRFLKFNKQIEDLTIYSQSMVQEITDLLSTCKKLKSIKIYPGEDFPYSSNEKNLQISQFNYIKTLELKFLYEFSSNNEIFRNIIKYFPNLSQLTLDITQFDAQELDLNEFLVGNLTSINHLDMLVLKLDESWFSYDGYYGPMHEEFNINWSSFINVRCLILDMELLPLCDIGFDFFPSELKEVRTRYVSKHYNLNYINDNQNIFENWNIKFTNEFIHFTK